MISIQSFIKTKERDIPIADFAGPVEDFNYIPGSIELIVNTTTVLRKDVWDDVNDLWPLLIDALVELLDGKRAETGYPDQPIPIVFAPLDDGRTVEISVDLKGVVKAKMNIREFSFAMLFGAQEFFDCILPLVPNANAYDTTLKQIASLHEIAAELPTS